jgi:hypothetical protein
MWVQLKKSNIYYFPSITDVDVEDSPTITFIYDKNSLNRTLPTFITQAGNSLNINPTTMPHVKNYTIIVNISDTKDTTQY